MTATPSLQILPWEKESLQTFLIKRKARLDRLAEQRRTNYNLPIKINQGEIIMKNTKDHQSINNISEFIGKLNVNTNPSPRNSTLQAVPPAPNLKDPVWLSFQHRSEEILREKEEDKIWLENRRAKITEATSKQRQFPKSNWPKSRLRRL